MTDSAVAARRVAALTLIPASVAVFGTGLAWATTHDPSVASAPDSQAATPSNDPKMAAAEAKLDDARTRLAELQAEVNRRNAERVAIQEAQAAGVAPASAASSPAAVAAAAAAAAKVQTGTKTAAKTTVTQPIVAAAPAAAPPVQTTTKASTKK